jgi:hypothetical protein
VNEVANQSAALLLDAVEQRGIDPAVVWKDLPVAIEQLREGAERIDWTTWVTMIDRVAAVSPVPMDELFVPGSGNRLGHPFVRIAQGLLSVRDIYGWLAKWGTPRAFMTMRGRFETLGDNQGRFTMTIDPARAGSVPSLQFFVGVLRHLPQLQGYPPSRVTVEKTTPHHAEYLVELPAERSFFARARRLVAMFNGMSSTLEELAQQATEIATKNKELETQLSVTRERASATSGSRSRSTPDGSASGDGIPRPGSYASPAAWSTGSAPMARPRSPPPCGPSASTSKIARASRRS